MDSLAWVDDDGEHGTAGRLLGTWTIALLLAWLAAGLVVAPFALPVRWGGWHWTALTLSLSTTVVLMIVRSAAAHVLHMD